VAGRMQECIFSESMNEEQAWNMHSQGLVDAAKVRAQLFLMLFISSYWAG